MGQQTPNGDATSSGESETLAAVLGTKAMLRVAAMIDETRVGGNVEMELRLDNSAVIAAISRAQSLQMAHMKRHAGVSFQFLHQAPMKITYVGTADNIADAFTKPLSGPQIKKLFSGCMHLS